MKASDTFKTIIGNYLNEKAFSDPAFATSFSKASKNFEDCINYIGNEVKKMGVCAFADEEIFAIAVKYYNDDTISMPEKINFKAVVNQPVTADLFTPAPEVTPETIAQKTAVVESKKTAPATLTLFDL